jgi:hypothetical protein
MFPFPLRYAGGSGRLHARALALGGADKSAPGERDPKIYFSYFRDLDGIKLCAFCMA